jgi:hypothetical protein
MGEFLDNLDTLNRIINDLRAELAAERQYHHISLNDKQRQIDKLREALVKSRSAMEPYNSDIYPPMRDACEAADAAISETKGDGGE